jgi:hypothetical protein
MFSYVHHESTLRLEYQERFNCWAVIERVDTTVEKNDFSMFESIHHECLFRLEY